MRVEIWTADSQRMVVLLADDWQDVVKPDVPIWWLAVDEYETVITLM